MSEIETLIETQRYIKEKIRSLRIYLADVCNALQKLSNAKTCKMFCMLSNSNRTTLKSYYDKEYADTIKQLAYYEKLSFMIENRLNYLKIFQY